jgi:hypothetical protein
MAEIVNLHRERKRKAKALASAVASSKRAEFGISRAERERAANERDRAIRQNEGHRLDKPGDGSN